MSRYLAQTALVGLLSFAAIWLYVVLCPMAFLDDEFPRWSAKQAMLGACHLGDLVVVGDSRAAVDIMPNALPVSSTNLALAGTSTVETYVTVDRLLRCPDLPRVVAISLSASHFAGPDTFWQKSALYRFLDADDLWALRRRSTQLNDWSMFTLDAPDDLPPWARILLYSADFPSLYFGSLLQNEVALHYRRNHAIYSDVLAARGQYFFHELPQGYDGIAAEGRMPKFAVLPILDAYFDRTLALLAARNIRAVFMPMPVNDATYLATTAEFRTGFAQYLHAYATRYKDFAVPQDTMPHMPNRLIGDDLSHLNQAGAAIFNRTFAPCAATLVRQAMLESCGFSKK
jgi:hypothetical protein